VLPAALVGLAVLLLRGYDLTADRLAEAEASAAGAGPAPATPAGATDKSASPVTTDGIA
jgi:hypothetical protein